MSWITTLIELVYPSAYSSTRINAIPSAPTAPLSFVFPLFDYHSTEGKKLVYFIKKYNSLQVSEILAEKMKDYITEYIAEQNQFGFFINPIIIPVPLSPSSKKKRGFNQNEKIAKILARHLSGDFLPSIIIKTRETKKQALLKHKSERIKNIRNAFTIDSKQKPVVAHRDIIIIDDLVTTGATLLEIKRVLEKSGARNIIAITVAH